MEFVLQHNKIELTPEGEMFFRNSFPFCSNDDICVQMGLSSPTMHRMARKMNLKKDPDWENWMRLKLGKKILAIKRRNGTTPPRGYIIPNSERFRIKKGESLHARLTPEKRAALHAKSGAKLKETLMRERLRTKYGLKPLTKRKVTRHSIAIINWRSSAKARGYIVNDGRSSEGMSKAVYYTDNTIRGERFEKNGTRHGFVILPEGAEYQPKVVLRLVEEGLANISFE